MHINRKFINNILIILVPLVTILITVSLVQKPVENKRAKAASIPSDYFDFFDTSGNLKWRITDENSNDSVTRITSPFNGVQIDCSKGKAVVLEFNAPSLYNGTVTFEFQENPNTANSIADIFTIKDISKNIGLAAGRNETKNDSVMSDAFIRNYSAKHPSDQITRTISKNYFFYATDLANTIPYINTFIERNADGISNTLTFNITPSGGYAKINNINLSYLPSNKDATSKPYGTFYPVNYSLVNFNQLQVGCPWQAFNNSVEGGILKIKNPVYSPILSKPSDRRQTLLEIAKNIHERFPYNALTAHTYGIGRIEAIRALADSYLYTPSTVKYNQIKQSLQTSSGLLGSDLGTGYSTMALAYWLATIKYPQLVNDGLNNTLDNSIKSRASYLANPANIPVYNQFISRTGADRNSYVGAFLTIAGTMFGDTDWDAKGKCFMFNSATSYYSQTTSSCESVKNQYGGNISTKNIYHGMESSSVQEGYSQYQDAINNFVDNIGPLNNGRLDNHNYGPNPAYIYGSTLEELEKASIALGSWRNANFGSSINHAIDNLWLHNLDTVDFNKNLWNSGQINKISPKSGKDNSNNPYWDSRYTGLTQTYTLNMYSEYSKSDNFLDPANTINGLLLGAVKNNNFSGFDALLSYIWYIANDYGAIPFGQQDSSSGWTKNLHPLYYFETNNSLDGNSNEYRFLIFPSTSI